MGCQGEGTLTTLRARVLRWLLSEHLVLGLCAVYALIMAALAPGFASWNNLAGIVSSLLPLLILAVGQTLVLITAGIDLSVTAIVGLASVAGAFVMNGDTGWLRQHAAALPAGVLLMLTVGGLVGLVNGFAIARLRLPAFIVTLTTLMFFSGLAMWLTESRGVFNLPPAFNAIGGLTWQGVPVIALPCALALAAGTGLALRRSLWGRWLYAVGHNPRTALVSGVPVASVITLAYVASGCCAACAAILLTGKLETASPVHGQRMLLDVVGAVVIGGTSLFGGRGRILWTASGALFLTLMDNSLTLLNLSYFSILMVKGAVILLAALIDTARTRWLLHQGHPGGEVTRT